MNDKGSLYVVSSDEKNIPFYSKEFGSEDIEYNNHKTFLIKYIFNNGLCRFYEKYSQREYQQMYDNEIMIPLLKNNFVPILGISGILFMYLPSSLSQRQYNELEELFAKREKEKDEKVILIGFDEKEERGEFVSLGEQFTYQEALGYISNNYLPKPSKYSLKS